MKELFTTIEKIIPANSQQHLYDLLEDERLPFEVSIKRISKSKRLIILKADSNNISYFAKLLHSINC